MTFITMDYKLQYITKLFQKTSNKAIENYVLSRLWHRLDNDQIKMVPQQYVNRHDDKYALTDVYFPQVNIHVEVNEPEHYKSDERMEADKRRKIEIENHPGHQVVVVDCRKSLSQIHKDIDDVVDIINSLICEQKKLGQYKPWQPEIERNPNFWKQKNIISVIDEISFNNIEDVCSLFNADFKKTIRGFQRTGGIKHPQNQNIVIWWPSEMNRQGWKNELDEQNGKITETNNEQEKRSEHYERIRRNNKNEIRYVFFHYKDFLGLTSYKFKGVFAYDDENSKKEIGTVWKKIAEKIILIPNKYE